MEKIRSSSFRTPLRKRGNSYVVVVPMNEIKSGKFKEGQMLDVEVRTAV